MSLTPTNNTEICEVYDASGSQELTRAITLTNEEWLILSNCAESYSQVLRSNLSQTVATYVTRGQLDMAVQQAEHMKSMLEKLDQLQVKLFS